MRNSGTARRTRGLRWPARVLFFLVAAAAGLALLPGKTASGRPGEASAAAVSRLPGGPTPTSSGASQSFGGTATVGALFTTTSTGKLGRHFCTATMVHSDHGDLAVTAAHCMTNRRGKIAFVPGYASGREPYGTWTVTAVYANAAWVSAKDPDDDVAFLRISGSSGRPVEDVTGAEQLGTSPRPPALVEVIAYPVKSSRPIWCVTWLRYHSPTQLQFDCGGYTNGTSGGPFLGDLSAAPGQGTVIGVIGGDDQGGPSTKVSYSSAFGPAVIALFRKAEAAG